MSVAHTASTDTDVFDTVVVLQEINSARVTEGLMFQGIVHMQGFSVLLSASY